jgi:protein transport protein SEC61 subunit alpha
MTTFILSLLDELLSMGWGISSGVSLAIATNICQNVVWKALSPIKLSSPSLPGTTEFEGAIPAFLDAVVSLNSSRLSSALFRSYLPNVTNLIATICIYLLVIYLQGFQLDLPLSHTRLRNRETRLPIKLFYASNMPIIIQSSVVSNLYFVSELLYQRYPSSWIVCALGQWARQPSSNKIVPVGGITYYMSAPPSGLGYWSDPIHAVVYIVFMLVSCAVAARTWTNVSLQGPRQVARRLREQNLVIARHRENQTEGVLRKTIPLAATIGGFLIGGLTVLRFFFFFSC